MKFQQTIKDTIELEGVGLHNGINVKLSIKPAKANFGIKFKRTDLEDSKNIIAASIVLILSPKVDLRFEPKAKIIIFFVSK